MRNSHHSTGRTALPGRSESWKPYSGVPDGRNDARSHEINQTGVRHRKLEIRLRFNPAGGGPGANIKVEINIDEVESLLALQRRKLQVDTEWWSGESHVLMFDPAEMLGTKFRALAQRSKGRDLNDLELARIYLELDDADLAACAAHYLHHEGISAYEFKTRLYAHLGDPNFVDDVALFITDPAHRFEPVRLVEKWIWWRDEFLDPAVRRLAADADGEDVRLDPRGDQLVQCASWIEESGNARRCINRFPPDQACPDHR